MFRSHVKNGFKPLVNIFEEMYRKNIENMYFFAYMFEYMKNKYILQYHDTNVYYVSVHYKLKMNLSLKSANNNQFKIQISCHLWSTNLLYVMVVSTGIAIWPVTAKGTQQNSNSITQWLSLWRSQWLSLWRCSHCSLVPDTVTTEQWLHRARTLLGIHYHGAYEEICLLGT